MEIFDITQYSGGIPEESIREEIARNSGKITVVYPILPSYHSHLDIMHDCLEASYIAEELGRCAAKITAERFLLDAHTPAFRYEIEVGETGRFVEKLRELSIALDGDCGDDFARSNHLENMLTYAEEMNDKEILCPDLADDYYANRVQAGDREMDSEDDGFLAREHAKYPERQYGFWKSAYSRTAGGVFYTSRECWVVPRGIDILELVSEYSGLSLAETYEEAVLFSLENVSYLAHRYGVVYFPFAPLLHARNFAADVLSDDDLVANPGANLLTFSVELDYAEERYGIPASAARGQLRYLLSESSQSIIVEDGDFRYVFFPNQIKGNKVAALYEQMSAAFGFVGDFAGVTGSVKLCWDKFNDEKFEELCYDIIYHDPRFDNRTIRKMGKSRSRDGGRDIEVHTRERMGMPKRKFIFQCKFTRAGSSLTTQKVENISDTIVQYGAQGYGVMAPVVIDAGLYDRIDAICGRFQIESDNWSVLEIERFFARHPKLKDRHFKP